MPSGCRPRRSASFSSISTAAEAPSDSCEALPAVMWRPSLIRWPSLNTGFSPARPSRLVSGRLPSSLSSVTCFSDFSPVLRSVTDITEGRGTISSSNRPACAQGALAGDVETLRPLLDRRADDDVVDLGRIDPGAPDRLGDRMSGERLRHGLVEGAAKGPPDRRARGGNDDGLAHGFLLR